MKEALEVTIREATTSESQGEFAVKIRFCSVSKHLANTREFPEALPCWYLYIGVSLRTGRSCPIGMKKGL
jgi:hypothetical protein